MPKTDLERFFAKVQIAENGCWIWTGAGARSKLGYGRFWLRKSLMTAHRAAYILLRGEIEEGKHLDHLVCSTPSCVNPYHVKPVTPKENFYRWKFGEYEPDLSRCANGHAYTDRQYAKDTGQRICAQCQIDQNRKYREKVKGAPLLLRAKERTHCPSGHEYTEENTIWYQGRRYCKPCKNRHQQEWRARKKNGA